MQIEIADKIYQDIEAIVGKEGGSVSGFIEQVLATLAARMKTKRPTSLPAELQAAVDSVRKKGNSKPATGLAGEKARSKLKSSLDALQSSFDSVNPDELQQWVNDTVEQVENEFRQRTMDANPT